jgi:hypothetical protein
MNLEEGQRQQELFGLAEKERQLEKAILAINRRFPNAVLRRSRSRLSD